MNICLILLLYKIYNNIRKIIQVKDKGSYFFENNLLIGDKIGDDVGFRHKKSLRKPRRH